jgi:hypothetical protein
MSERAARRTALGALAPWVTGLVLALPVVLLRFPPMRDLPLHEAVVGVLRHWGDAAYAPPGLYTLSFGMPNQLFFLLAWPLSLVLPVPLACKLVAALPVALMPVVAGRFAESQGRPAWVGVLAAPVMLGWLFVWGVVANMLGLVVLFAALPALDRWTLAPSPRSAAQTFGVLLLLDLAHEEVLMFGWAFVLLVSVLARPRRAWLSWAAVLASLGVAVLQQWRIEGVRTAESAANRFDVSFTPLLQRLKIVPGVLFPGQEPAVRAAAWLLVLAPLAWMLVARRRLPPSREPKPLGERLVAARFCLFGVVLGLGYLLAPNDVSNSHLVFHRFLPPACVLAVTLAAPREAEWEVPWLLPWVALAAPLASLAVVLPTSLECARMYRHFERLLAWVDPGQAVLVLDTHATGAELLRGLDLAGHAVALRGGRTAFDYTQSPTSPALLSERAQWPDSTRRMIHGEDVRPAWDLRRFRYVLVRLHEPNEYMNVRAALEPEAHVVDISGDWMIFESDVVSVPVDAPDAPLPSPRVASFAQRFAGAHH